MCILIDFETFGNPHTSRVVSAAMVEFDRNKTETIEDIMARVEFMQLDYRHEEQSNWVIDKATVDWWKSQPDDVREKSLRIDKNSKHLSDFVTAIDGMLNNFDSSKDFIWSRGNSFDIPVMDRIFIKMGKSISPESPFYNLFRVRDVRTFVDAVAIATSNNKKLNGYLYNVIPDSYKKFSHDPVYDVARDAFLIQFCQKVLSS
jgi:hypothetical protein